MKSFIDYVFYRLCQLYSRYGGKDGEKALSIIILTELVFFVDVYVFTLDEITHGKFKEYKGVSVIIIVFATIIITLLNLKQYRNRFESLNLRWKTDAPYIRHLKGWSVLTFLLIPWALIYIINRNVNH